MSTYVTLDSRNRLTLGKSATSEAYLMDVEPDGTLVLTPAVAMSKVEASLLARPDILDRIEASRAAGPAKTGRPTRRAHMDAARVAVDGSA